jgi:hypothetical protein
MQNSGRGACFHTGTRNDTGMSPPLRSKPAYACFTLSPKKAAPEGLLCS